MPIAARLLSNNEPEPFYGQRLLSTILDKNKLMVKVLRNLNTTSPTSSIVDNEEVKAAP